MVSAVGNQRYDFLSHGSWVVVPRIHRMCRLTRLVGHGHEIRGLLLSRWPSHCRLLRRPGSQFQGHTHLHPQILKWSRLKVEVPDLFLYVLGLGSTEFHIEDHCRSTIDPRSSCFNSNLVRRACRNPAYSAVLYFCDLPAEARPIREIKTL